MHAAIQDVTTTLDAICDEQPYTTGWYLKDLRTGEAADRNGSMVLPSASTRKVSILMAALAAIHAGSLALSDPFTIDADYQKNNSGTFQFLTPGFAITFRDDNADTGTVLKDLGVDISRILHGEQEFESYKPIRPGETYLCRSRITDIYEKTGRSGAMAFVVREMTVTDPDNEIVSLVRHITVVRL